MTERVAWAPQPGKQQAAIASDVRELFYGGARGGGKTDFLLGDWLLHQQEHGGEAKGIIFRRTLTEMEDLEQRAITVFTPIGVKYTSQKHRFTFPNGSVLLLRYLDNDIDAENYQGHSYTWVGIDEVGNFPNPEPIDKIRATLRSVAGIPCYMRLTGNPGGPGHHWVQNRYIRTGPGGAEQAMRPFTFQPQPDLRPDIICEAMFIPARLEDNILLQRADPGYEDRLAAAAGPQLYKAWRYGDWNAIVGAVFAEWRSDLHVVSPDFVVPPGWRFAGGLDWGYRAPGSFVLFAMGPDQDVVAVDEIYFREQTGPEVGRAIGHLCRRHGRVEYIAGDTQMWQRSGVSAPTIAEEVQVGIVKVFEPRRDQAPVLIGESKTGGYRAAKLVVAHSYLAWKAWDPKVPQEKRGQALVPPWGMPRLRFKPQCKNLVRTLPALTYDPLKPEDVDTHAEDHSYDSLAAFLMSRPPPGEDLERDVPHDKHPGFRGGRRKPRYMDALVDRWGGDDIGGTPEEELVPYRGD